MQIVKSCKPPEKDPDIITGLAGLKPGTVVRSLDSTNVYLVLAGDQVVCLNTQAAGRNFFPGYTFKILRNAKLVTGEED